MKGPLSIRAGLWRRLLVGLRVFVLSVVGFWVVFHFAQTSLIFHSDRELTRTPDSLGWPYEDVTIPVGNHTTHGWFIPVKPERGVVLYCHGNDGNMATHLGAVRICRDLGFSVLLFDYGGFGASTGHPSEKRSYADAEAMWRWLTGTRQVSPGQIVVWGTSFGGGTAAELATRTKPAAVVLESTYLSIPKAAFRDYPWFPTFLVRHRFDNERKMDRLTSPLLVIHSLDDELYPFEHGQRLYELANSPKQFLEIRGDHCGGTMVSAKVYRKGVEQFLTPLLPAMGESGGATPLHEGH